jgi:hypothetical protein
MLVHFRERIDVNLVNKVNREIVKKGLEEKEEEVKEKKSEAEDSKSEPTNRGKLILDASCAPADISYPTDLGLLNKARKHTETIIDILYNSLLVKTIQKPRTYRNLARKNYLLVAKKRKPTVKERGIRISGPPLGRPPKNVSPEKKKQAREDELIRNSIEGKFGQGKRRFSLDRVMAKLPHTSLTAIAITFLVMNLSTLLSRLFCVFLWQFFKTTSFFPYLINKNAILFDYQQQKLIFALP